MATTRQVRANRVNAQASTGPTTILGKARVVQNAWRHGLSLSIRADPNYSALIESLASEIAGEHNATVEIIEIARRIAEAEIDLNRIREARRNFLAQNINDPDYGVAKIRDHNQKLAKQIGRRIGMLTPIPHNMRMMFQLPLQGPRRIAAVLSDAAKQLVVMDRYERRALSRRKFAIPALDALRRQSAHNTGQKGRIAK